MRSKARSAQHRRLNITLPESLVQLLDQIASKGDRSRLIAIAVERYVQQQGRARLKTLLRQGAVVHAHRDRRLAEDWFALGEDAWPARPK